MPTDPRGLRDDAPLLDAWLRFHDSRPLPFTIPGHKQRRDLVGDLIAGDVPLYAGLDTMKLTRGVLADAQARAAALWGADIAHFSVGGSTHGNQALALAIAAQGGPGSASGDRTRLSVLVSRGCHRSLQLGLVLAGLDPIWLPARVDPATGLPLAPTAGEVSDALARHPEIAAVFLTDPSYVGTHADLAGIARVCHGHGRADGIPLVVDAAWAAHFGFHPDLPPHPLAAGADAMVTSAHKSLPAWSQAAIILARGARIDLARLETAVDATHTTSPSGAILASIDAARALLARDGRELLGAALGAVRVARDELGTIPGLRVLDGPGVDPLKLTLVLGGTGADGNAIEADLLAAGMALEMADRDTLVAMVTLADTEATVARLTAALTASIARHRGEPRSVAGPAAYSVNPEVACSPREAYFAAREAVVLAAARGRVAAELVAPYPPGIPIIAPGELITTEVLTALAAARAAGARIAYAADPGLVTLQVMARPTAG